jgi:hypothetical protein
MHVADFWSDLSEKVQKLYKAKATLVLRSGRAQFSMIVSERHT